MSFIIGLFILFWILLGIVVLGFIVYNVFQKGHKPVQVLPVLLVLVIAFGLSAVNIYYHATQASESINSTSSHAGNSSSSSSSNKNNLYR